MMHIYEKNYRIQKKNSVPIKFSVIKPRNQKTHNKIAQTKVSTLRYQYKGLFKI